MKALLLVLGRAIAGAPHEAALDIVTRDSAPLFRSYGLLDPHEAALREELEGDRFLKQQVGQLLRAHGRVGQSPASSERIMRASRHGLHKLHADSQARAGDTEVLMRAGLQGRPDAAVASKAAGATASNPSWWPVTMGLLGVMALSIAVSWREHHVVQLLGAERTSRMLLLPGLTAVLTMTMTHWNYLEFGVPAKDRTYYVSNAVNYPLPEAWGAWLARWYLWHGAIFAMTEFKCRLLPREAHWLPLLWALSFLVVIWSGIHQWDVTGTYCCEALGVAGPRRFVIHAVAALATFCVSWWETVCLWWPDRRLHVLAGSITALFLLWDRIGPELASKFAFNAGVSLLEVSLFLLHASVVWTRAPLVKDQVEQGSWRPWVPCCQFCCPRLEALPGSQDTPCWPPAQAPGELLGAPIEAKA